MEDFDARLAAALTRGLSDFAALVSVRRLSGGASQETYRVEIEATGGPRTLAFRRAAGGGSKERTGANPGPGLAGEARLMQVARQVGVPEPAVVLVLEEDDGLGEGFLMEWLEGETLGGKILKDPALEAVRPTLAFECGRILARIHGVDPVAAGLSSFLEEQSTRAYVEQLWAGYRAYDTPQPMIDYTARWLLDHLPEPIYDTPRLVHNDFRNGNLMITPDGIMAVLDWEVAYLGDPVRDLGWICTNSWRFGRHDQPVGGFGSRESLLEGYETESGIRITPDHLRWWEVFGSFWWAVGTLQMAAMYRGGVDASVERPGIARRSSECQVDCANLIIPGPVELVAEGPAASSLDMPRTDELLESVRDFLRNDLRGRLKGRDAFLSLVASNSLDIVLRELTRGPAHVAAEQARLVALLGAEAAEPIDALRRRLAEGLRDGSVALDRPGLADHLRVTVVNQLAIDQPRYSGLAAALAANED
ncbi:MAG: phosphotransferase family protein [bacterium]|nr:phosphotransferase family protein [bacterium]